MSAKSIFVGGTSSNCGKSWMATALCAWLHGRGVSVAPFKAQNMSNNSYACLSGGEIGRAQVAQAEACRLEPEPVMNPILLKPTGDGRSQVIVRGQVWKTLDARAYFARAEELRRVVFEAYRELAGRFEVVVIEGAGSVSEINLRRYDLVNLALVTAIRAPWLLVADIDRGGVFASVTGTLQLLTADERSLFRGFAINRFRGDRSLFDEGVPILEARTASRCLGVFPHVADLHLDPEDSLALDSRRRSTPPAGARVAVVHLPHLSNATDFRLLTWADWLTEPPPGDYDFVILPGTKSTLADLGWLRRQGLAAWLAAQHRRGATIVGICGGYQMLGESISDPDRIEGDLGFAAGLRLLPVVTHLRRGKQVRRIAARTALGIPFCSYEIHVGQTVPCEGARVEPFARLDDGSPEGARRPRVIGTYLHGALENPRVCTEIFGVEVRPGAAKDEEYVRLAEWFERHVRHVGELGIG